MKRLLIWRLRITWFSRNGQEIASCWTVKRTIDWIRRVQPIDSKFRYISELSKTDILTGKEDGYCIKQTSVYFSATKKEAEKIEANLRALSPGTIFSLCCGE